LRADGSVVTWGWLEGGGDSSKVAAKLDGTIDVIQVFSTFNSFAALRADGSVVTWGSSLDSFGGGDSSAVAAMLDGTIDVTQVFSTSFAFAALRADGSVVTWGDPGNGGNSSGVSAKLDGTIDVVWMADPSTNDFYSATGQLTPFDTVREGTDTTTALAFGATLNGVINAEPISGDGVTSDGAGGYIDKDWYQVTLTAGHTYHFGATATVSDTDTLDAVAIRVCNAAGTKVSTLEDGASPGLDFTPTSSGKYYLAISAGGDGAWQTKTGDYQVSLADYAVSPVSVTDTVREGTDSRTILAVEGILPGVINADPMTGDDVTSAGVDKDWYEVTLQQGHVYHFGASAKVNASDTLDAVAIRLYDASGSPLAGLLDDGASTSLDYTPGSSGTYYLAVGAGGAGDPQSKTGNFEVWLEDKGAPPPVVAADSFDDSRLWTAMADFSIAAYRDEGGKRSELLGSANEKWELIPLSQLDPEKYVEGLYQDGYLGYDFAGAFVARWGDVAVIAFEGTDTDSLPQWLVDVFTDLVSMWPHVDVLKPLVEAFDAYVADPANGITKVYVTGHSLGGALASEYMLMHPDGVLGSVAVEAVTFAAPGFNEGFLTSWATTFAESIYHDDRVLHFEVATVGGSGDVFPDLLFKTGDTIHLDCQGEGVNSINPIHVHSMELYSKAVGLLDDAVSEGDFPADPNNEHVLINTNGSGELTDFDPLIRTEYLVGGAGDDTLGGTGVNKHYGGAGNDTYKVDQTGDLVIELNRIGDDAGGSDTVNAKCDYTLSDYVEKLVLKEDTGRVPFVWDWFDEPFSGTGNNQNNWIDGNDAANVLKGMGGDDTLWGKQGNDTLDGGTGNDTLGGGTGDDRLVGGLGDDNYRYWLHDDDETISDVGGNDQLWLVNLSLTDIAGITQSNTQLVIEIDVWGFNDTLTIESWYAGSAFQIETFRIEDMVLSDTQFKALVEGSQAGGIFKLPPSAGVSAARSSSAPELAVASLAMESPVEGAALALVGDSSDEFFFGTDAAETVDLAGGNDRLYGRGGDDSLAGGSGNDWLDGGTGADTLAGGLGDDTYVVDDADDVLSELAGEGIDSARIATGTAMTYQIGDNVENVTITSMAAVNLIGNAEANLLTGNDAANYLDGGAGNDTLIGQGGNDVLIGGAGDDSYQVNLVRSDWSDLALLEDTLREGAGQGSDTLILETADHATLGSPLTTLTLGANLETLDASLTGATRLDLTGNALNNVLIGNAAGNVLDGGAGTDTFVGGLGDDTYVVDSVDELATITENASEGNDTLQIAFANPSTTVAQTIALGSALGSIENIAIAESVQVSMFGHLTTSAPTGLFNLIGSNFDNVLSGNSWTNILDGGAGNDTLDGLGGGDTLNGGDGNDTLEGGAGGDFLSGGDGDDRFVFTSKLAGDADRITDFTDGDLLVLEGGVFAGLGAGGALAQGAFVQGTMATTSAQHLLYDAARGYLYYDADGSGVGAKVLVAALNDHPVLDAGDFWVA
jgi:Ca2+-binding RTX toxin-like protein